MECWPFNLSVVAQKVPQSFHCRLKVHLGSTIGSPLEICSLIFACRRHFRQVLKQQMADQDAQKQQHLKDKVRESEAAVEYDRQCRSQDLNSFMKKFSYLKQFRDDNKTVSHVVFVCSWMCGNVCVCVCS